MMEEIGKKIEEEMEGKWREVKKGWKGINKRAEEIKRAQSLKTENEYELLNWWEEKMKNIKEEEAKKKEGKKRKWEERKIEENGGRGLNEIQKNGERIISEVNDFLIG